MVEITPISVKNAVTLHSGYGIQIEIINKVGMHACSEQNIIICSKLFCHDR